MPATRGFEQRQTGCSAFTLFEIALSLLVISFAVISAMLLFPVGVKAQTMARFQIYASAKALEMVDSFNSSNNLNIALDAEGPGPWDVPGSHGGLAPDLERRLSSYRFGIFPLPLDIALRLDSDSDEIQHVLSEGGYLYYSQPLATTGFKDDAVPESPPNEAQKLVFTITGYAQQNAITCFPWKAWPYYYPYPSPPLHGYHRNEPGFSLPPNPVKLRSGMYLYEDSVDPQIAKVVKLSQDGREYGFDQYEAGSNLESAKRYVQAALWYCAAKGLPTSLYDGSSAVDAFAASPEPWAQVLALRYLTHAATCLTAHATRRDLDAGIVVEALTHEGTSAPRFTVTTVALQVMYDNGLRLAMQFAARFPYDWRVPRPANRMIMMDHPLLHHDLHGPLLSGTIAGTTRGASQWRSLAARTMDPAAVGRGFGFMDRDIPATAWSASQDRFNLTAPFSPSERARQIVFWAVDWQSYEDFETAPSAPVDASKYLKAAPGPGATMARMMSDIEFRDWRQFGFRNPEKALCFKQSVAALATGTDVAKAQPWGVMGSQFWADTGTGKEDQGDALAARERFCGLHGADRNRNNKLDRGSVPRSQRLRAVQVARFNYYDLRVGATLR